MSELVLKQNQELLKKLQGFLIYQDQAITTNQMNKVMRQGVSSLRAYSLLLKTYLDINESWIENYLPYMVHELKKEEYENNPYFKNIRIPQKKLGKWRLGYDRYEAYQAFVCNDFILGNQKEVYPQIGFFSKPFTYPAVYENNVMWMSVTPNEVETMKEPIENAKGKVLTFGLGLGYYAYMVSLKDDVRSITVVERDENVIQLFEKLILPQFSHPDKVKVIQADAYEYLSSLKDGSYDYLFIDIYHDAGDGLECYRKFSLLTKKLCKTKVSYWIEKTISYYL